jgi:hypothetical protein
MAPEVVAESLLAIDPASCLSLPRSGLQRHIATTGNVS